MLYSNIAKRRLVPWGLSSLYFTGVQPHCRITKLSPIHSRWTNARGLSTWAQPFLVLGLVTAGVYCYKCLVMVMCQSKLIYMSYIPFGSRSSKLSDLVRKSNLLWEPAQVNRDHCTLRGFIVRAKSPVSPKNGPVVIYFQGNAGNMVHREPVFQHIVQAVPTVTIVAIHTSGYGNSQGTATERNLRADAYSIFQFVRERYPPTLYPIYIYGHSLGGALAIDLANRLTTQSKPGNMSMVCGVVLENTFTSMLDLVGAVYPRWLPYYWLARYCLWNHWPNVDRIQAITVPILFLSAAKDNLVPPWMMTKLSQKAKRPQWVTFPYALHDNLYQQPGYKKALQKFIQTSSSLLYNRLYCDDLVKGSLPEALSLTAKGVPLPFAASCTRRQFL